MGEVTRPDHTTQYPCSRCREQRSLTVTSVGPIIVLPNACQTPAACELEMLRDYYVKPK